MAKSKKGKARGGYTVAKTGHPVIKVVAVLLVLLVIAYVITSAVFGQWNPLKWVKQGDVPDGAEQDKMQVIAISDDGKKFLTDNSYVMPRAMAMINKQSTYSKSPTFTVTASLSNQYINGRFDWSVDFVNPSDSWAVGKVAEYYVQAIPASDGSATATIKYISTFSSQIKITATLRGSDSSDSCTIDCVKPMQMTECWTDILDFGDRIEGGATLTGNDGTVFADYKVRYAYLEVDEDFSTTVQSYLKFSVDLQTYRFTELINKEFLHVEERSDTHLQLGYVMDKRLEYSDFVNNFEAFDDEHKEAVYYAWYRAALECDLIQLEVCFDAYVNGVKLDTPQSVDKTVRNPISGKTYGKDVKPNVQLNQNYIVGG